MDAIVEGPPDDGGQDLNLINNTEWITSQDNNSNNSTLLYISVEYKMKSNSTTEQTQQQQQQSDVYNTDFEQHVSPLDPNMSSVARYSPVYNEPTTTNEFNPVVIHQLVQSSEQNFVNNSLEVLPTTVLCNNNNNNDNPFLQLTNSNNNANDNQELVNTTTNNNNNIDENEREVELLITDQATGISYSVRSQEFLVERCLDDEQLLHALSPDPLLETDLLALDENTLKTELNDDINNVVTTIDTTAVCNYVNNLITTNCTTLPTINTTVDDLKIDLKRNGQNEIEFEDQLLSRVYSIIDKPVPSRARATLPESYLFINKVNDEYGVFAKKNIPKRTQFGPMTGTLIHNYNSNNDNHNKLQYFIEDENGKVCLLDVSDENVTNWMSFVRKANNYNEQNLVITLEDNLIYFTTTQTILAKKELKVGYSMLYAKKFNLPILIKSVIDDNESIVNDLWPCFECSLTFKTSNDLQKHLNVHDDLNNDFNNFNNNNNKNEDIKPKKKFWKNSNNNRRKLQQQQTIQLEKNDLIKCKNCNEYFESNKKYLFKQHLINKHKIQQIDTIEDYFNIVMNYKCLNCNLIFDDESLLKLHNLSHESNELIEHLFCPSCNKLFLTQRQLIQHITSHALSNIKINNSNNESTSFKCPICHKMFAFKERLSRHMLVHGSEESKPLQCTTCKKRFLNNSALAGHIKTHYVGKKIFECPICKLSFDHVLKLKLHVPNHCENNLYKCPHCTKVYKKYSIIRKHIRAFHSEQKHSCQHCTKMFPTLDKLRMHLLRHSDHREFLCADCGKQFKRKDKLKEHCKRMHSEERENNMPATTQTQSTKLQQQNQQKKKLLPKVEPTDFHRFIYKCHTCLVGFKRRGMLVNHLAKRHPDISPDSVPELNLPILQTTRDYYCQHCDKVYKSNSKRKAHILKIHPGAALPISNRKYGSYQGLPNPSFSQTVGSITTRPQNCQWCHKQYASKAKLLQHQRKKHIEQMTLVTNITSTNSSNDNNLIEQNLITSNNNQSDELVQLDQCLQQDFKNFKVSESDILSSSQLEDSAGQYCHLVTIANGNESNNDSNLYRLLTISDDGMVPPR